MTEEEIVELKATNDSLVARVNQLESINTDLVDQKKQLKQKLEDGSTDEELKAELNNYKQQLEQVEADKAEITANYRGELNTLNMVNALKEAGIEAQNNDALSAIANLALDGAEYKDGSFMYANDDGTTKFNEANKSYGIIDRVNELKGGDKSYLFAPIQGGGGVNKTSVTPDKKTDINAIINAGLKY